MEQVNKLKKDHEDLVRAQKWEEEKAKLKEEVAAAKEEAAAEKAKSRAEKAVSFFLALAELPMMLQFCNPDQLCI